MLLWPTDCFKLKMPKKKKARARTVSVAQEAECRPSKHKTLSSNPSTAKKTINKQNNNKKDHSGFYSVS
jgi:hypothetical protein